jgi:hypothetical protein
MAFLLSDLLAEAIRYQGTDAFDIRIATGGSSTTIEDTLLEDKYEDESLNGGTIFVVRTESGLPPQGEFSQITNYSDADTLITFNELTDSIVAGDTVMIVTPEYPLPILIEEANDALRDCGEVSNVDILTTTVADITEYSLPPTCKNLIDVYYQAETDEDNNNMWDRIDGWRIIPSEGNVPATIVFKSAFEAGHLLMFVYNGFHPVVSVYNSPISEAIPRPVVVLMLADKIMQWYGVNDYNRNYANKILDELAKAKAQYPVRREKKSTSFFTFSKFHSGGGSPMNFPTPPAG